MPFPTAPKSLFSTFSVLSEKIAFLVINWWDWFEIDAKLWRMVQNYSVFRYYVDNFAYLCNQSLIVGNLAIK